MFETVNPATGQAMEVYPEHDHEEVVWRLARAASGWEPWVGAGFEARSDVLRAAADGLEKRRAEFAELMTLEMGKPIAQSEAEVDKCAWVCRHYAEHGAAYLAPEVVETEARRAYVRYDPLGPALAIMPWNFPFWQVFRFAAPALMAGNPVLLKHAANVPGCALAIEGVLAAAGAPEGVFQVLLVGSKSIGETIADDRLRGVTLTGSEGAGRSVAASAGQHLKKTVLELGGSDAFVVLEDADVARAAEVAVKARLINSGQSCIAAKRFVVHDAVAAEFEDRFRAGLENARVGDPLERDTEVGPLARDDLRDDLHDLVEATVAAGAQLVTGGERIDGPGFFYRPTLLTGVSPQAPAAAEETFGPVATVLRVASDEEAVAVVNGSRYGLGASLWTSDLERGEAIAARLEVGAVFVNEQVKSDPRLPFGGVKASGYGRELGAHGIREFANVKTVWVA